MRQSWKRLVIWNVSIMVCVAIFPVTAPAGERTEIRVGVVNSVSGKESATGKEIRWAYQRAAEDVNRDGGIYIRSMNKRLPVRLIIGDDESDAAMAAKVAERLIYEDRVDAILGTHPSNQVLPSCKVAERHKTYYHSASCFMPKWLEVQFHYSTNLFFDIDQAADIPFLVWNSLPPDVRPKHHALLMEGTPDGDFFGDYFKKRARVYGYHFTLDEPIPDTRDYLSLILKMKAAHIDSVLIFGDPADCITLVRQIKKADLNLKYFHGWKGTWTEEFWKALGSDAQYVICDGFWSEDYPYPGAKKLGGLFYKTFGKRSVSVGLFYGACQVLWQAMERAGVLDAAAIRDAVASHLFKDTVLGDIEYSKDGAAIIPSTAHQWWNGEQKWFYPPGKGAWTLRLMPGWHDRPASFK